MKAMRGAPTYLIARELGVSISTVERDLNRAVRQLKRERKFGAILECVHAVATCEQDALQPNSVECRVARGEYVP